MKKTGKNKLEWTHNFRRRVLRRKKRAGSHDGDACRMKMTNQCCLLCLLGPILSSRLLPEPDRDYRSPPPEESAGLSASRSESHDQGTRSTCLSPQSYRATIHTPNYTSRVFSVHLCPKILHLYLQPLNRGQLSTCVVSWRGSGIQC